MNGAFIIAKSFPPPTRQTQSGLEFITMSRDPLDKGILFWLGFRNFFSTSLGGPTAAHRAR